MPLFLIAARAVASLRIAQLRIMPHSYALEAGAEARRTAYACEFGGRESARDLSGGVG